MFNKKDKKMKTCKKCGVLIDEKSGDLCEKCIQIANGAYNTYEKVLKFMSYVILIGGILSSLIMIKSIVIYKNAFYEKEISEQGLIITLCTIIFSIVIWAILSLIVDLSVNIRVLTNRKMNIENNNKEESDK